MIDLEELREAIKNMTYQQGIFKVLKEELNKLGYWRNRPRGKPEKGYAAMMAKRK